MPIITDIESYGTARQLRLKKGEEILAFSGRPFVDILDYVYADGQEETVLTVRGKNGAVREVRAVKEDMSDTLGLSFDESVEITPITCKNNCVFCFVNQMPGGLRETLAVKDDDYRLSFISGTYVTCTNWKEEDILRIIEYKLSPLYVSVHASEHATRLQMLGVKNAPNQMDILKRLVAAGIRLHTQIVLVGGMNDGDVLDRTLADLHALGENLKSIAVIPVGLTKHRAGLPALKPLTQAQAADAVRRTEAFHQKVGGIAYCADELYSIANLAVKDYDYYEDFPQIENGVGLVTKFLTEIADALPYAPNKVKGSICIITGVAGAPVMEQAKTMLTAKWRKLKMDIYPIQNKFFGETVTVSGLVTAGDIIEQMRAVDCKQYDAVLLPMTMLKEFDTVFLDNVSLETLEKEIGANITLSPTDGEAFVDIIAYGEGVS